MSTDPNILNVNSLAGTDTRLTFEDASENQFIHTIFPYKFRNKDTNRFGKPNTTLIVSISNDEDAFGELYTRMKKDHYNNPYFNAYTYEQLKTQIQINNKLGSYTVSMINKSTFTLGTNDFFTEHTLERDENGLPLLDNSSIFCFTIDEPFDEVKYFNDQQHVFFIDDKTDSLDAKSKADLDDLSKGGRVLGQGGQETILIFLNAYDKAAELNTFKIGFTLLDFNKFNMAKKATVNFSDYPRLILPLDPTNPLGNDDYVNYIIGIFTNLLTADQSGNYPILKPYPYDTFVGGNYNYLILDISKNGTFPKVGNTGLDYVTDSLLEIMAFGLDEINKTGTHAENKIIARDIFVLGRDTTPPIFDQNTSIRDYKNLYSWNLGVGNTKPNSNFLNIITAFKTATLDQWKTVLPNLVKGIWDDKVMDVKSNPTLNVISNTTFVDPSDLNTFVWAKPTPPGVTPAEISYGPFPYGEIGFKVKVNSDALVNLITVEGTRNYSNQLIDRLEQDVFSSTLPMKVLPIQTTDQLILQYDWLDWNVNMPFVIVDQSFNVNMEKDVAYPNLYQLFFTNSDTTGTQPNWTARYGSLSILALQTIGDMIAMTHLVDTGFQEIEKIIDTTSVNYGKLDPLSKFGYFGYSLATLNQGSTNKIDLVNRIYDNFVNGQNLIPETDIWKVFHMTIAMLSRYITCTKAIAQGGNIFNRIYQSFHFDLIDPINIVDYPTPGTNPPKIEYHHYYFPVLGEANSTPPRYPINETGINGVNTGKLIMKSKYYNVSYNDVDTNGNIILNDRLKIFPIYNHKLIGDIQFVDIGRRLKYPILPDELVELPVNMDVGDINPSSEDDLAYLCYIDTQSDLNAFQQLFLKNTGIDRSDESISLEPFDFQREGVSLGKYPQPSEITDYITLYVKNLYNVDNIDNIEIINQGVINVYDSINPGDIIRPKSSEDDYLAKEMDDRGIDDFRAFTSNDWINEGSSNEGLSGIPINGATVYSSLQPTTDSAVFPPDAFTNTAVFPNLLNMFYWYGEWADKQGDEYYHLTSLQLIYYFSNTLNYDYSDDAGKQMLTVKPYTGSSPLSGDNPRVYFREISAFQGEIQADIIPRVSRFENVEVKIRGRYVSRDISSYSCEFNKSDWLRFYTIFMGLPVSLTEYNIIPKNSYVSPLEVDNTVQNTLEQIYIRGIFVREAELHLVTLNGNEYNTQIIKLPVPQDLDDLVTIRRFVFLG